MTIEIRSIGHFPPQTFPLQQKIYCNKYNTFLTGEINRKCALDAIQKQMTRISANNLVVVVTLQWANFNGKFA